MKKVAKTIVVSVLSWQLKRLTTKNRFKVIGIAGSIGKTSTKFAIASVLKQKYKVGFQKGNYNDVVTVPLVFFNQDLPALFNPFGWLKVFIANESLIRRPYPYEIVIVELGTDGPGQIAEFGKYLDLDVGVLTSIATEHMEYFKDLDAIAEEELEIAKLSRKLLVNTELCDEKYLRKISGKYIAYTGKDVESVMVEKNNITSKARLFSAAAALKVGQELGLNERQLEAGLKSIRPVDGRMNLLNGINGSKIIDDTYNAGPESVKEAIDTLYDVDAPYRIAVLGTMNELGDLSADAHRAIGRLCDPKKMDLLLTIGREANKYLASSAKGQGCEVMTFDNPYEAGEYLSRNIRPKSIILAKGSQNGVFAEEAVKYVLADPKDRIKLVRQSPRWLKIKSRQFNRKGEA